MRMQVFASLSLSSPEPEPAGIAAHSEQVVILNPIKVKLRLVITSIIPLNEWLFEHLF